VKKVLIINGHQYYEGFAEGKLTQEFIKKADEFFLSNGFEVKHTVIDIWYDPAEELEKLAWADAVVFQYPVYWMSVPWITKKYIDEVFSGGVGKVTYESDGRSREDASKKYGSGGLLKNKKYMLSLTYNCPKSEFDNKEGFFEGLSLDEANFAVHKVFQFCGMEQAKTYAIFDVYKGSLALDEELAKFENTLKDNFL